MALAAVRPLRLVLTAAALLVLAPAAACGGAGPAPHPSSPAPHSPSPAAGLTSPARASSTPADLSGVLIQPAGFSAVPDDTVSGPLQTATDVRNFFTDRPGDPGEILGHGFAGGYVQRWQPAQNPSPGGAPALLEVVLQFDTAAHALAVEQYFKHARPLWPVTDFAVPSRLTAGYGQYQIQGTAACRPTCTRSSG